MLSQKKEILDICSIACEKFTGGEKTAKLVEFSLIFTKTRYELMKISHSSLPFRERQPELAAFTILNSLKEKVDW